MEFIILVVAIIFLIATNKIWSGYIAIKSEEIEVSIEDMRTDLQPKIKEVYNRRKKMIKDDGWVSIDDIRNLTTTNKIEENNK